MPTLYFPCSYITLTDVKTAIKKLKHGKAAGEDEITREMLNAADDNTLKYLLSLYNNIWQSETPPNQWKNASIVLPKAAKNRRSN
jgi:hypothetical protein